MKRRRLPRRRRNNGARTFGFLWILRFHESHRNKNKRRQNIKQGLYSPTTRLFFQYQASGMPERTQKYLRQAASLTAASLLSSPRFARNILRVSLGAKTKVCGDIIPFMKAKEEQCPDDVGLSSMIVLEL